MPPSATGRSLTLWQDEEKKKMGQEDAAATEAALHQMSDWLPRRERSRPLQHMVTRRRGPAWSRDPWDAWGSVYTAVPVQRRQSHGTTSWPRERQTDRERKRVKASKEEVGEKRGSEREGGGRMESQTSGRSILDPQWARGVVVWKTTAPPVWTLKATTLPPPFIPWSSNQSLQMAKLLIKYLISTKTEKANKQKRISVFV